ncbi:hypothetical protein DFH28DRAFT_1030368 [Melampsora americana]|nr:hypothetical protein DFH28DRAFT_1030368 [Melampsora americana]
MSRSIFFKRLCFSVSVLSLVSTVQNTQSQGTTLELIMRNQESLLHGDIDRSSNSHLSKVKSELKRSRSTRKQEYKLISDPISETHITKRIHNDQSRHVAEKTFEMAKEGSNLDFLTIHLQPHLWSWQETNHKVLRESKTTNTAVADYEEGELEEGLIPNRQLDSYRKPKIRLDTHCRLERGSGNKDKKKLAPPLNDPGGVLMEENHYSGQKALSVEGTHFHSMTKARQQLKHARLEVYSEAKKPREESLRDELSNILVGLEAKRASSGYMNMRLPTVQFNRLIEIEKSMKNKEWNQVLIQVRVSLGKNPWKYWERAIKAQIEQFKLIEDWKSTKIIASDNLKDCMKLLKADEHWPVYVGIEYKTFQRAMNLIKRMHSESNGHDLRELCKLIQPRQLQNRLSRMEFMSQWSDIIHQLYSDEELKSKQEDGFDLLVINLMEQAIYMATQIQTETSCLDTKDKKAWDVFVILFRVMGGEIHNSHINHIIPQLRALMNPYWRPSIEFELFTCGSTPQSHRFKHGFEIALKQLEGIQHIYKDSMNSSCFFRLMRMAGNWSLPDILLGIHNGMELKKFKSFDKFSNSHHHSYNKEVAQFEKKEMKSLQEIYFHTFLKARMELQKRGRLLSYRPLKSLRAS